MFCCRSKKPKLSPPLDHRPPEPQPVGPLNRANSAAESQRSLKVYQPVDPADVKLGEPQPLPQPELNGLALALRPETYSSLTQPALRHRQLGSRRRDQLRGTGPPSARERGVPAEHGTRQVSAGEQTQQEPFHGAAAPRRSRPEGQPHLDAEAPARRRRPLEGTQQSPR